MTYTPHPWDAWKYAQEHPPIPKHQRAKEFAQTMIGLALFVAIWWFVLSALFTGNLWPYAIVVVAVFAIGIFIAGGEYIKTQRTPS